jgi:hypothetical protein
MQIALATILVNNALALVIGMINGVEIGGATRAMYSSNSGTQNYALPLALVALFALLKTRIPMSLDRALIVTAIFGVLAVASAVVLIAIIGSVLGV